MTYNDDKLQRDTRKRESKHGHGTTLYCSVFNVLGVDRKLRFRAIDRRQARQKWSNTRSIHGHVWFGIFRFLIVAHHYCGSFDALETRIKQN